jgi:hypothetical protein
VLQNDGFLVIQPFDAAGSLRRFYYKSMMFNKKELEQILIPWVKAERVNCHI